MTEDDFAGSATDPVTDDDRRFAETLGLPVRTIWIARQPLPPLKGYVAPPIERQATPQQGDS